MKRNGVGLLLAAALALPMSGAAMASDRQASAAHPSPSQIVDQQTALRRDVVAARGPFKDLSERERKDLIKRQDAVIQMLTGRNDVLELMPHDRVTVFNDLEWIKAAVTQAERDRKVCERMRPVGSNRFQTICTTAGEKQKHRDDALDNLQRPQMCNVSDCVN